MAEQDQHTKPDKDILLGLFREVNEHMRATEVKHLQLALGYMSLLALALSILATFGSKSVHGVAPRFIGVSWAELVAYGALSAVGCIALFILDAYRGWKQHYRIVARWTLIELGAGDMPVLPRWLSNHPYRRQTREIFGHEISFWGVPSPDNALTYFIGCATALAVAIFNYVLWSLVSLSALRIGLVAFDSVGFVAFVLHSRRRVVDRVERDHAMIDQYGLFPAIPME